MSPSVRVVAIQTLSRGSSAIQTENLGELFRESYLKSAALENAVSSFQVLSELNGTVPLVYEKKVKEGQIPDTKFHKI